MKGLREKQYWRSKHRESVLRAGGCLKTSELIFGVVTFQMAQMILSVFLCSSCLLLALADVLGVGPQWRSEDSCEGSLTLTAAEDPTLTRTFPYVKPSPNCQTENLRPKFKISRVEVQGCGTFIIYTRKNGLGASQDLIESYGPLTAADIGISTVRSIEGTGCFEHRHKHKHSKKGIKKHIENKEDIGDIEENPVTNKNYLPPAKRTDDPGDAARGYFASGEAQDQFQNQVNQTEDFKYKTMIVVIVLIALILFAILGIVIFSKQRSTWRYSQP